MSNPIRTRVPPRAEISRWTHHAADFSSGQVLTDVLDQPPTAEHRARRLSQLRPGIDSSIFGGPSFRLTARAPHLTSPEAWLTGRNLDYFSTRGVGIQFIPPANYPVGLGDIRSLRFFFSQLPAQRSLLSIALEGHAWIGRVGHVSVGTAAPDFGDGGVVTGPQVRIPFGDVSAEHTLDFTFEGANPPVFVMTVEAGIAWLQFDSVTLRRAPLVVGPAVA